MTIVPSENFYLYSSEMDAAANTGRWTEYEHKLFVKLLRGLGRDWKQISERMGTRTPVQVRTHAQKFFLKLSNAQSKKIKNISEFEMELLNVYLMSRVTSKDFNPSSKRKSMNGKMDKTLEKRKKVDYNDVVTQHIETFGDLFVPRDIDEDVSEPNMTLQGQVADEIAELSMLDIDPEINKLNEPMEDARPFWFSKPLKAFEMGFEPEPFESFHLDFILDDELWNTIRDV